VTGIEVGLLSVPDGALPDAVGTYSVGTDSVAPPVGIDPGPDGVVLLQLETNWQSWMQIWNLILMQARSWS